MRKLVATKAIAAAAAASSIIFNRGNAAYGLIAALLAAAVILGVEVYANRKHPIVLALNMVGLFLVIPTGLLLSKMPEIERFYLIVIIFTFVQMVSDLIYNTRNGWYKKKNLDNLITFALHAIIWAVFVWVNLDAIGLLGAFGTYCALLAVHWGIEATGPKREG